MKLLKCSVQNFGTLQDFSLDFNDGLTVVREENGFGKSTLAVFIKAMFYSLPPNKKKTEINDRQKYLPWQGGVFGGSLDFEAGGRQYRIERTFGDKERNDTFKLFDLKSGRESTDFSSDIGVELFGIDADSFERSIYMPQNGATVGMSNSLSAKLTGLVENSDDLGNFDSALKALDKRMRYYSLAGGARGTIPDKRREIEGLEQDLKDGAANVANLNRVNLDIADLKQRIEQLIEQNAKVRQQITLASDAAALKEQQRQREELESSVKTLDDRLNDINSRYPNGVPTELELSDTYETVELLKATESELSVLLVDTADRDELEVLNSELGEAVINAEDIKAQKEKLNRLERLQIKAESLSERLKTVPTEKTQKSGMAYKLLPIVSTILAAAGGITLIWLMAVGIVLIVLGLLGLGASAFLYLKSMIVGGTRIDDSAEVRRKLTEVQSEAQALSAELDSFTLHYKSKGDVGEILDWLQQAVLSRERLQQVIGGLNRKIQLRRERVDKCSEILDGFFAKYGMGLQGRYSDRLSTVNADVKNLASLSAELKNLQVKLSALPDTMVAEEIEVGDREELLKEEERLNAEISLVQGQINKSISEANKLSLLVNNLPETEELLDNAKLELEDMESKYEVLSTTAKLLISAKESLSLRYLDSMKRGFKEYSVMLGFDACEFMLDTDLTVQLERDGSLREKAFFSEGFCDMMDIAMRLSLADALSQGEQAVLILDDPFVNLDDRRLENALKMLNKLAEKRQIVYLTCHSSRV